jgi:hypothetical protein
MLSTIDHDEVQFEQATIANPDAAEEDAPLCWEARVFLVALLGLVPGIQFGCILALCLGLIWPAYYVAMALGGLLGMIAGGLLEADHWL